MTVSGTSTKETAPDQGGLASTLDGSPVAVWAQDVDLRYLWIFNPSMGLSAEGMVGKTDHDVLDGPTAERLTTLKRKAMNTGEDVRETVRTLRDGHDETHDLFIKPVMDDRGAAVGVSCVATRLPDSALTLADEANHRIKNSLLIAQTLLRMQRRESGDAAAREALRNAEGQLQSIARFHGKLAAGNAHGWVNIRDYLETTCADLVETFAEDGRLEVTTEIVDEDVDGQAALKLALIVSELITNAFKHGSGRDRLRVHVAFLDEGDRRRLVVEDDGEGLPSEFDPGSDEGIGMRIVRAIAGELGAPPQIDRRSSGARFVFDFPDS